MVRGLLSRFLEGIAAGYANLAGLRNCPGVTPTIRLKCWQNWLWLEKPAQAASVSEVSRCGFVTSSAVFREPVSGVSMAKEAQR